MASEQGYILEKRIDDATVERIYDECVISEISALHKKYGAKEQWWDSFAKKTWPFGMPVLVARVGFGVSCGVIRFIAEEYIHQAITGRGMMASTSCHSLANYVPNPADPKGAWIHDPSDPLYGTYAMMSPNLSWVSRWKKPYNRLAELFPDGEVTRLNCHFARWRDTLGFKRGLERIVGAPVKETAAAWRHFDVAATQAQEYPVWLDNGQSPYVSDDGLHYYHRDSPPQDQS